MAGVGERKSTILIPYTSFPNGMLDDEWFHIVHCAKEKLYFVFRAVVERGLGDYEKISCPCCGGNLEKDGNSNDSYISATNIPEAIACLKVPSSGKTLKLAHLEFVTEEAINALSEQLARLPSLKSFSRVERISELQNFREVSKFLRRKSSSNSSYIELSKSRKIVEKQLENDTLTVELDLVSPSELVAANPRLSKSYLERLREEWLNSRRNIELTESGLKNRQSNQSSKNLKKPKWFMTALTSKAGGKLKKTIDNFYGEETHSKAAWDTSLRSLAQERLYRLVLLTEKKSEQ